MVHNLRPNIEWVLLTQGDRASQLGAALESLGGVPCWLVLNGVDPQEVGPIDAQVIALPENVGVPAGRDAGIQHVDTPIVGFLDDDARAPEGASGRIASEFLVDDKLGAVSLRLVDENGETARRHVPRFGGRGPERSGEVALFLGGACAIRRSAYIDVGGYFSELFYGHEELELCWRLVDAGWKIRYLPDVEVYHPRTEVGRHAEGWFLTGRNRVWVARRSLPWPIAIVHVSIWLGLGLIRAPAGAGRTSYLRGWREGWKRSMDRRPISWRGVWRLTKLGRPPIV